MTCGLVWSLGLATIGLAAAGRVPPQRFVTSFMVLGPLFGMPAALLGARIVQQRRGNRLGWILLAMGLAQTIAQATNAYSWLSINRHGGGLAGSALATWLVSFAWMPDFALGPYLLLLFPNGQLPGRRWRPAAWAGGAAMAALIAACAVLAWPAGLGSLVALSGLLGAIAVAVFRYRLYDIDRLLNRTLVYGLVTAILGTGYAAPVIVLGQLLGRNESSLVIAGATLAAAALFRPLRRRVQQAVDRRFDRRRYDAARTIERFSGHLREEVDLDMLSGELLRVVDQTVEPTTVWLWLQPRAGPSHLRRMRTG
jgi:hypothetical protein